MLKKEAIEITGGLSKPSKMPGPAFNLPAWNCITGGKLRKIPGTPCHGCYALKGRFRWHDSGDIQSAKHLTNIFEVCKRTPGTRHWLPTQERKYLQFLDPAIVPPNLIIRLSGSKIDGPAPKSWPWTSSVVTTGRTCPAPNQDNECKSCRNCWNKDIKNISYGKH